MDASAVKPESQPPHQAPPTTADSPFHVLMVPAHSNIDGSAVDTLVVMDPRLQRDFIAKRYAARQALVPAVTVHPPTTTTDAATNDGGVWLGVSDAERALVSCCESPQVREGDETMMMMMPRGALAKTSVFQFIRLLTLNCHDLALRSLALAILERSLEVDGLENVEKEGVTSSGMADSLASTAARPIRGATVNDSHGSEPKDPMDGAVERSTDVGRLQCFLESGGLRILDQWLQDAFTPVQSPAPKPPPSSSSTVSFSPYNMTSVSKTQESPTGALLLPLLKFLKNIPFDKALVKESKITKRIKTLSNQVDALVDSYGVQPGKPSLESYTHELAGGLSVVTVKRAVDELKRAWEEKAKASPSLPLQQPSAFDTIQQQVRKRLDSLSKFQSGDGDKPDWYSKLEEIQKTTVKKRPSKKVAASMADLAKKERDNERAAMMRKDLHETQENRRRLLFQLRELKQKTENDDRRVHSSRSKRSVQWKDGQGPMSKIRAKEKLEEVFFIPDRQEMARLTGEDVVVVEDDEEEEGYFASSSSTDAVDIL